MKINFLTKMLVEFSVTNFRSICQRQTLTLVASAYDELQDLNTFDAGLPDATLHLLRSAVLYGPNASGKSTLIQALAFLDQLVLQSHRSQIGDLLDLTPFKLTAESRNGDSKFEITIIEAGVRYEYGVSCNSRRISEEWLLAYPLGMPQKWFHRVWDVNTAKYVYKFSTKLGGGRKRHDWAQDTLENTLYLSKSVQNNQEQLRVVFNWFKERLRVVSAPHTMSSSYTVQRCAEKNDRRRIVEFLNAADLGIADIRLKEAAFSVDQLPKNVPKKVREQFAQQIAKDLNGKNVTSVKFVHQDVLTQELIEFAEDEESDGTRALFAFAGPWLDVTENERILVVDELDTSLHPMLVHFLVKHLHHTGSKAQLIFTTHDTSLLSQKILRRDQVWFMEKNSERASNLYPLSDFSPRENEAIERGYLNGRYGGIPFLKDLDFYGI
ncbi:ATP-binding protein [Rhodoferax sp. U2-2l]|uniref:AAA family ATPase n=1 Tax=Rhodoferax sp. U2-2l TaxID=2884000 RepID=UPI001D0A012A|nr:ATP-binding protein [Rhodoferax sp. U2-2l]MCB8747950.1 ATP-binding protein [Rhodoferax sp. U2-2l]